MKKIVDLESNIFKYTAKILLQDKTTKGNIIWATDTYKSLGKAYQSNAPITGDIISGVYSDIIQPRVYKSQTEQAERTRKRAEVFTPTWLCNKMNNYLDTRWFGRENVFNSKSADNNWIDTPGKIEFPKNKTWQQYVDMRRLEVTCGEAPYLVSRYDATTGEIIPIEHRIGILDRKLRVVNENAPDDKWLAWTMRAFESTYGYEYQGDNLLLARVNLMMTFADYYMHKWHAMPDISTTKKVANRIAWNIWQMDGLKGTVPQFKNENENRVQISLFSGETPHQPPNNDIECLIYDWRKDHSKIYNSAKERKMKFDFVIGNPPYQDETVGAQKTFMKPVYNFFMDAAYQIADKVMFITPARFLFNAGATPKKWNEERLNDPHFKVLEYKIKSNEVFTNVEIKGGGGYPLP